MHCAKTLKTESEHIDTALEITKLMMHFSWNWKHKHESENTSSIIIKRTCLCQLLSCEEDDPTLVALAGELETIFKTYKDSQDSFINASSKHMEEFVVTYAENNYQASISKPADYNAGSLKYDPPLDELPQNHCNFHIANAAMPDSIFTAPEYLPNCFLKLMDKSEAEFGYDTIRTFTWLNSNPRWLALFPEEWQKNMEPPYEDIWGNYGFWGQLLTARGTLNEKAAQYVRQHTELRYKPRKSHCSFQAMRQHLKTYLQTI